MAASAPMIGLLRGVQAEAERKAITIHREVVRGSSSFPPPRSAEPRGTFLHGFLLPFSLIVSTLRHPTVGLTYLKLIVARALVAGVIAMAAFHTAKFDPSKVHGHRVAVATSHMKPAKEAQGLRIGINKPLVPEDAEVDSSFEYPPPAVTAAAPSMIGKISDTVRLKWAWIVWFVGIFSLVEGALAFLSRRYDDWIGFHGSLIAGVRPEDLQPKPPAVSLDLRWLWKKTKRRLRGYLVFGVGIPFILLFRAVPWGVGEYLFSAGITIWGWYWLTVFTAAKSGHAWADDGVAPSPYLIRELGQLTPRYRWLSPVHSYLRLWARFTRSVNAPAGVFERTPASFLGLTLARIVLSIPIVYLVARPVIPVAAGRLCAESDPWDRFSVPGQNA